MANVDKVAEAPVSRRQRESDAVHAEYCDHFKDAALVALEMANDPGCHPGAADFHVARAQVYATLHQADMALWIAENRAPIDYGQMR